MGNKLGNWLKNQMAAVVIATSNMEKNALGQDGSGLEEGAGTNMIQSKQQGSLADALMRGEVTQQVKELRWRMYKILNEVEGKKTIIVGHQPDGTPITESIAINPTAGLEHIKIDNYDNYPLELSVENTTTGLGVAEALGALNEGARADFDSMQHKLIECTRPTRPMFEIETYAKKMNVRVIGGNQRLLEFYISMYPDQFNRRSNLFLGEVKNIMASRRPNATVELSTVNFVSLNTVGTANYNEFEYAVTGFDKIVEYDGHYVIKFKANVVKNGSNIFEKYRVTELDEKYKNNEPKQNL